MSSRVEVSSLGWRSELEKTAIRKAHEAVTMDSQGDYKSALKLYRETIEILMQLYTLTDNDSMKRVYLDRIREYQKRVEKLEGFMKRKEEVVYINKTEAKEGEDKWLQDVVLIEKPSVRWEDIINLEEAKKKLYVNVIFPTIRPDVYKLPWSTGILFYGPPGCGKTLLAAALANSIRATFYLVKASSVLSKWLGESEKNIARLFEHARRNSSSSEPAILFIDEVESIVGTHIYETGGESRARLQLQQEMDGLASKGRVEHVYVIAATNNPWLLPDSFLRRFEERLYVPPPDITARKKLFMYFTSKLSLKPPIYYDELARLTEGYSAHDIENICKDAFKMTIEEFFEQGDPMKGDPRPVSMEDLVKAIKNRGSSISRESLAKMEEWRRERGSA
ncbi:MAG: ATP-binding protein [Thermoproteota archaeon]|nr:ATP-binding protein [Candidatus Brockarchaeota archaeon]